MSADPRRVKDLFVAALDLPDPAARAEFLDRECAAGDPELRRRVEALLAAHDAPASALELPFASPVDEPPSSRVDPGVRTTADFATGGEVGQVVAGRYKLIERIGEGGMGEVWTAQQTDPVRRVVAVKLIKAGMDSRQVVARFEAERQALALMDHANIARVLDGGTTDAGRPFFVMELVRGVPITRYCDEHHLTPRERLELFVPVCQAVQHAHQKGVIHRDLKPSNVLVAAYDGRPVPKVIDFGVAKAAGQPLTEKTLVTGFGSIVGTLEYMSPEQAEVNQLDIDTRSDIYSLGVLLYELLTGGPPFSRKELETAGLLEMLRVIREQEPSKPSTKLSTAEGLPTLAANRGTEPAKLTRLVRGELDWIVMKALEKDRNRRYETANGFAMDVQRYLAEEAVLAGPPSAAYRLRKFARRNRIAVLTASGFSFSIVAGTAVAAWQAVEATRAKSAALTSLTEKERALTAESAQRTRAEEQTKLAEAAQLKARAAEADTRAFSEFLVEDVLAVARPKGNRGGLGIHVTVKEALDTAAANIEHRFHGRPQVEAIARHDLGVTYRLIGELDKSEAQLRRAYELRINTLGPGDKDTLNSANSLAVLYNARGNYAQAEPLFVQALDGFQRTRGEEDEVTLSSMNNLAILYREVGRLAEAEKLLVTAYDTSRRVQGNEHPETLTIMNSLGSVFFSQGRTTKAEPLQTKALEVRRRVLGDDHSETLQSMNDVAMLRQQQGRFAEAEALHLQALDTRRRVLGEFHPHILESMNNLAGLYHSDGDLAKAEPLLLQALELSRRIFGEDNPSTVDLLNNLAGLYHAQGKLDKAEPILVKAVEGLRRVRGDRHVNTIVSMGNLGALYRARRDFARAERQLLATLDISRHVLGEDNSDTLSFVNELRLVYEDQGQFSKGEALCRELLDMTRKSSGGSSPGTASAMAILGLNLLKQDKFADAEPILRECLKIREQYEAEDWRTFNTRSMLGASLLGQQKYADAEPLLLGGYKGMMQRESQIPISARNRLTEAVERLVRLHEARNQPGLAAEWRKKLPPRPPDEQD